MFDTVKDLSIICSFDRTGYERHARHFSKIDDTFFQDKSWLVTGGTGGIGSALTMRLLRAGARVYITGRDEDKFSNSDIDKAGARFLPLDLTDFKSIHSTDWPRLDGLVCNAGGMPDRLEVIDERYDVIFASQVVGHYVLIKKLINDKHLAPGSPIHINSSGGMYLARLRLDDLNWQQRDYNKVKSYANAKRAQVILNEELSALHPGFHFSCSHPGWVDSAGLKEALPEFTGFIGKRLRTADQGADTIYWCLSQHQSIASGKFWFDRQQRAIYPFFWTREKPEQRRQLIALLMDAAKLVDTVK